ncbi:MAG: hypothetical protein GY756_00100 [bacterium]|nr:hypothetical protein [bacterium]
MIKKIMLVMFFVAGVSLFGDVVFTYPDYYYVEDQNTGFRLLLGGVPSYIQRFYGDFEEQELLLEATDPKYQIWREKYSDGFTIIYDTYDLIITSIKIKSESFVTSKGIRIGSLKDEVLDIYGFPTYDQTSNVNQFFYYESFFNEINLIEGEKTVITFLFNDNIVSEIILAIKCTV